MYGDVHTYVVHPSEIDRQIMKDRFSLEKTGETFQRGNEMVEMKFNPQHFVHSLPAPAEGLNTSLNSKTTAVNLTQPLTETAIEKA